MNLSGGKERKGRTERVRVEVGLIFTEGNER